MNPSLKLLLLCLLTIEITIIPNLIANLCLIVGSLI
ncbi:MAG: energy-coupling factor transporter transmembrane protein EcfT, partial [Lactobacillus iners]